MSKLSKKDQQLLKILRQKQVEVSEIPPQQLGVLTPYYKIVTSHLKTNPWKLIFLMAFTTVMMFRLLFGASFVKIATILQAGF